MAYSVFYSDVKETTKAGFGKVSRLPCIFDNRPSYERVASRYLIDRGLGIWGPVHHFARPKRYPPTDESLRNYANWLINFLEWSSVRGVDIQTCEYFVHIQGRYQDEMLGGLWSRDKRPLSPKTVNLRVNHACEFITWMVDKGIRKNPFEIPSQTTSPKETGSQFSGRARERTKRIGKARENKRKLFMPSDEKLKEWLDSVYREAGYTYGLMSETVLMSALRRAEVSSLRTDFLPANRADWRIVKPNAPIENQHVHLEIRFGAKGKRLGPEDHGDKLGPMRLIRMPLLFAERLADYRDRVRNAALRKWVKSASGISEQKRRMLETPHLFLDEHTGERITGKDLYNAWTSVSLPVNGWCPHLGRDWWACSTLWNDSLKHENLSRLGIEAASALIEASALTCLRFIIMPQLGHQHESTSMIYVQWLMDMVGDNLPLLYEQSLDVGPPERIFNIVDDWKNKAPTK